jgi:hypothetical protein
MGTAGHADSHTLYNLQAMEFFMMAANRMKNCSLSGGVWIFYFIWFFET